MTLLVLIRHALTGSTGKKLSGWTPDVHLSSHGREQAEALAARLEQLPFAAIYSSPLERCLETAAPLASAKGLRISRRRDLGEVRYGDWTGRSLKSLMHTKLWRTVQQNPAGARFPNGESLLECQHRVVDEAGRIADAYPGEIIALVSHGDPLRLLLAHYSGMHVDQFQRLIVSPASVSVVALGEGVPRILRVNDTGDLTGLLPPQRPSAGKVRG